MLQLPNAYYRTSVKALVLGEKGTFLLTKAESGTWDLPGGGLNWGEDPREGIAREVREEMDIETTFIADHPSYFLTSLANDDDATWINNVIYIAKLKNLDFVSSDECIEIGFFSTEDARQVKLFPNVVRFLELYDSKNHA